MSKQLIYNNNIRAYDTISLTAIDELYRKKNIGMVQNEIRQQECYHIKLNR